MLDIHQLSATLKIIQSRIEENGGEITPDIEEAFNKAYVARDAKLDALAQLMATARSEELLIRAEKQRLGEMQQSLDKRTEYLEKLVGELLPVGETWNGGLHKFSYRTSKGVVVDEGVELPEVYYRTKMVSEVDKAKLNTDLKGGAEIPGARLETRFNLNFK